MPVSRRARHDDKAVRDLYIDGVRDSIEGPLRHSTGEMLIGHVPVVSPPAFPDFVLRRTEKVDDDRVAGDTSVEKVESQPYAGSSVARDGCIEEVVDGVGGCCSRDHRAITW